MKVISLYFLISITIIAQVDTSMYGLRGYEDLEGNTQLFYRIYSDSSIYKGNGNYKGVSRNDIYHFDVNRNIDSLFIFDYINYSQPLPSFGQTVSDFEFVDNTLTNFYQCGDGVTSFEPNPVVVFNREYDNEFIVDSFHGITLNIEVSRADSNNIVYVSTNDGIYAKSSNWEFQLISTTENYRLVSINKNQQNIMFVENKDNYLFKSIDTGATFYVVDSSGVTFNSNYINRFFFYDSDSLHIYRVGYNGKKYYLQVSDNSGEQNTWQTKFESESEIFISYDSTQSGSLFIGTNGKIYTSDNYGETFKLYKKLSKTVKGIYKKPNSDLLFVTTPYSLLEINSDSINILKQMINYEALSYYPLHIGDKWQYKINTSHIASDSVQETKIGECEIIGDTIIQSKKYFIRESIGIDIDIYGNNPKEFLRIDSITGLVYNFNLNKENIVDSLFATENDTTNSFYIIKVFYNNILGLRTKSKLYLSSVISGYDYYSWEISENFGFSKMSYSDATTLTKYEYELVYAKINGKEYGTLVGINVKNNLQNDYKLSQNYPNPFNPTTTIKYQIPEHSAQTNVASDFSPSNVELKIYDILGKEVTTLVNKKQNPGNYKVIFDASNLSSGVYYYQLKIGRFTETKKMLLLR